MAYFSKHIDMKFIEKLRDEPLFQSWLDEETLQSCLLEDMLKGEVFATIRDRCVEFFYGGFPLFTYDGTFKACLLEAFVPQVNDELSGEFLEVENSGDFVNVDETTLACMKQHMNFKDAYEQIKMRRLYAGEEGPNLTEFYKFSFAAYPCEWYFVLDTAIELDSTWEDWIALLLMDAHTGKLLFCASQFYSHMRMTAEEEAADWMERLERYRARIAKQRKVIIEQYGVYVRAMQALTSIEIPAPTCLCDDCGLLIYGFDEDQKNGKLKKITDSLTKMGWLVYAVEDVGDVDPETLFTQLAKGG